MRIFRNVPLLLLLLPTGLLFGQNMLPIRHVILIGVDGMSPDGIRKAHTPVMDRLMSEGAYTLKARCVTPSSSSSNWASMIMGADVEQHGIHSNDYERDDFILPPVVQGRDAIFPTIFGEIDQQIPDAVIGAIYHWKGFGRLFEKFAVDVDTAARNENLAAELAADFITKQRPTFCFIHLDHVDHAGHESGHGSPAYYAAVSKADSLIGRILQSVQDAGMASQTLVIVSADHGGIGLGHGGLTLAEMEIPFLLWGAGVKEGYEIPVPVFQYDNAATVAFALGLEQPYAWIGRAVSCAFKGFDVPKRNYPVLSYLEKPVFVPKPVLDKKAGGLFFKDTLLAIENHTAGEIRYTLDGTTPTAASPLFTSPVSINKNTVAKSGVFQNGVLKSEVADAYYRFLPAGAAPAVSFSCFLGEHLENLPDTKNLKAVKTGKTYEFTTDGLALPRNEQIVVVFESNLHIAEKGTYKFFLRSDDGSKLYIDGRLVVNNDGNHGVQEKAGKTDLEPGKHSLKVEWYNGGGNGWLDTYYQGPGVPKQIIPANVFSN